MSDLYSIYKPFIPQPFTVIPCQPQLDQQLLPSYAIICCGNISLTPGIFQSLGPPHKKAKEILSRKGRFFILESVLCVANNIDFVSERFVY